MTAERVGGGGVPDADDPMQYDLRLYVAGDIFKSASAIANLERVCREHLAGVYRVEVIDLLQNPRLAAGDQIVAVPTLVRQQPEPLKRIIGDLSNTEELLAGLEVKPLSRPMSPDPTQETPAALVARIHGLQARLDENQETLDALRSGAVDAILVKRNDEYRLATLETADRPFRVLVEQIQEAAVTLRDDGTLLYCNGRLSAMLGMPYERLSGQNLFSLLLPEDVPSLSRLLHNATLEPSRCELTFCAEDGTHVPVYASLGPLPHDGGPAILCGIVTDLTRHKLHLGELAATNATLVTEIARRKQVEDRNNEIEASSRLLVQSITDYAIYRLDAAGVVISWNPGAERLKGYDISEIIGQHFSRFFTPEDQAAGKPALILAAALANKQFSEEGWRVSKDGSRFWARTVIEPILGDNNHPLGFASVIEDLTARHRAERVTTQLHEALLVRQEQLIWANADLERFAYIASHDLRSPLLAIVRLSEWISDDVKDVASPETLESVHLLRQRALRLDRLTTDLLSYARLSVADTPVEIVQLDDLIKDVTASLAPPSGFRVESRVGEAQIETRRPPLEHVFRNLISNAIKHHDRAFGRVVISACERGVMTEFRAEDDGPGIAPRYHQRIFSIFETLQGRDERETSGIGLSIVKRMVEKEGGKVWIESAPPIRGTAFVFTWLGELTRRIVTGPA